MSAKIERLKKRLAQLEAERMSAIRNQQLMRLPGIDNKIAVVKESIAEAMEYEPQAIHKLIPEETLKEMQFAEKVIKTHIAADYLTDCAMDLRTTLDKMGLKGCSLFPLIRNIEKLAADYAAIVCHPDFAGLQEFMVTNETLIDEMHGAVNNYIHKKKRLT